MRGSHCKCAPGTLSDVISIVMQRKRKTVPESEKNLLIRINLPIN